MESKESEENADFLNELEELSEQIKLAQGEDKKGKKSINKDTEPKAIKGNSNFKPSIKMKEFEKDQNFVDMLEQLNKNCSQIESQLKEFEEKTDSGSNPFLEGIFQNSDADVNLDEIDKMFSTFSKYTNFANTSPNEEQQKQICHDVLEVLLSSKVLSETILTMKKSILESLEKNKKTLKPDELEKYNKSLEYAENILSEAEKEKPNKEKIVDWLFELQKISEMDDIFNYDSIFHNYQ